MTEDTIKPDTKLRVIVQAGGRGSRLRHHTWNKPKCLVSVKGRPILYHLFDRFPDAEFVVIGDYLFDTLENYLRLTPPAANVRLINAGSKGTASGVADAFAMIPDSAPTYLVWADLVFTGEVQPDDTDRPTVFLTDAFTCRWVRDDRGHLIEKPGTHDGVIGLFYFPGNVRPFEMPNEGEFVRWLSQASDQLSYQTLNEVEELGDFASIEGLNQKDAAARFFNSVTFDGDQVIKRVIDANYADVHENEIAWYDEARQLGFTRIPAIYSTSPLTMSRIKGQHAFELHDLTDRERGAVIFDHIESLASLHSRKSEAPDLAAVKSVYIDKTTTRIDEVREIIPGIDQRSFTVNGVKCKNYAHPSETETITSLLDRLIPEAFHPIHGDPTFSNTMVDKWLRCWFIDPRGSFGSPGIMGDRYYDFAKLYYSAVGNYDAFNRKKFKLYIDSETVEVLMDDPPYAAIAQDIFREYFGAESERIEILHALIWLSLTGYVKDDVDSMIGSFYLGMYWMQHGLSR